MKNHCIASACLFLVILSLSNSTKAQNWALLNSGRNFNFAKDTMLYDSLLSVRVTSSALSGNDSVFQLNRLVMQIPNYLAIKNTPNFLQRSAIKYSNGDYYFYDNSAFFIRTMANVGDSWIFDTANSINASVTLADTGTILGTIDSVKFISLSSGDTLLISKEHGLIEFSRLYLNSQHYTLAGIENPNEGMQVPKFNNFFNYHAGDVLEYRTSYNHNSTTVFNTHTDYWYTRYNVLSSSTIGLTTQLYVQRKMKTVLFGGYGNPPYITFTTDTTYIELQDSANHHLNAYRSELGQGEERDEITFLQSTASGTNHFKNFHETFHHYSTSDTIHQTLPPYHWLNRSYLSGIGLVLYHDKDYNFDGTYDYFDSTLTGAIVNGISYGTLSPDSFFTDEIAGLPTQAINIFPNPVSNQLQVTAEGIGSLEISLYNDLGQLIVSRIFENQILINTSDLPAGNYIYEIRKRTAIVKKGILVKL